MSADLYVENTILKDAIVVDYIPVIGEVAVPRNSFLKDGSSYSLKLHGVSARTSQWIHIYNPFETPYKSLTFCILVHTIGFVNNKGWLPRILTNTSLSRVFNYL
jgi:hypothetical protein